MAALRFSVWYLAGRRCNMGLGLMKKRIRNGGVTLYGEQVKDAQDILAYGFTDDISYNPHIVIYNTLQSMPVKIYDKKYSASYGTTAKFLTPYTCPASLGELLYDTVKNEYWLCIESYDVAGIHYEGKLGLCNRFIKWQEADGFIQEIPVISRNATQYNNGTYEDKVIRLGSDQILLYTQLNQKTSKLARGTKFFIGENQEKPLVYELTKPDTADYSYMGKGMAAFMVTECAYTPSEKELGLGICNYHEPDIPSAVPPYNNTASGRTAVISGSTHLRKSYKRVYTAFIKDKDGRDIPWEDHIFNWNVTAGTDIIQDRQGNKIELLNTNGELSGSSFLLQVCSGTEVLSEIEIYMTG